MLHGNEVSFAPFPRDLLGPGGSRSEYHGLEDLCKAPQYVPEGGEEMCTERETQTGILCEGDESPSVPWALTEFPKLFDIA